MRLHKLAVASLGLAVISCGNSNTGKAAASNCRLDLVMSPDGTPILTGDCPRDASGIAAAFARAPGILQPAREIALGRTAFGLSGPFDRCAVMARLAADPRWTASIDSNKANVPLRNALQAGTLAPAISAALAKVGRKLRGVSLETVLLSDGPANDCPKSPAKAPIDAQTWLRLE